MKQSFVVKITYRDSVNKPSFFVADCVKQEGSKFILGLKNRTMELDVGGIVKVSHFREWSLH